MRVPCTAQYRSPLIVVKHAVPCDGGGRSGGCGMEEEALGAEEMEVGRRASAADMAPQLVLGGAADMALHGDVGP